jgi:hypothetical protein
MAPGIERLLTDELLGDQDAQATLACLTLRAQGDEGVRRELAKVCRSFLDQYEDSTRRGPKCVSLESFIADRLHHDPPRPGCAFTTWLSVVYHTAIMPGDLIFEGSPYHDLFMAELGKVVGAVRAQRSWARRLTDREALSEAYRAVVKAAERYQPERGPGKGATLFTYAAKDIMKALWGAALADLPKADRELLRAVEVAKESLWQKGIQPTPDAVTDAVQRDGNHGRKRDALRAKVVRLMEGLGELDGPMHEVEGERAGESMHDPTEAMPGEECLEQDDRELGCLIWRLLALDTSYRVLLPLLYGDDPPMPTEEIASLLGYPDRWRVVRLRARMLKDAREHSVDIEQAYGPDGEDSIRAIAVRCSGEDPPPPGIQEAVRRLLAAVTPAVTSPTAVPRTEDRRPAERKVVGP